MKKKTQRVSAFLESLHDAIVNDPQFRKHTELKDEAQIQTEIRPIIIKFLEQYFLKRGYKRAYQKANKSFYWEGQEKKPARVKTNVFSSRNYPDFIITAPYLIAIEYKQGNSGSAVKHGLGQSLIHTMSGEFDFSYFLFHDENREKFVEKSMTGEIERKIVAVAWSKFNVLMKTV